MSAHHITIIPAEPGFVPLAAARERAGTLLRRLVPSAREVAIELYDELVLVDCGGSLYAIGCPGCRARVPLRMWHAWMDSDWGTTRRGFTLTARTLPCCGTTETLHALHYEPPMGFARCAIVARDYNCPSLSSTALLALETSLACPIRVIYARH